LEPDNVTQYVDKELLDADEIDFFTYFQNHPSVAKTVGFDAAGYLNDLLGSTTSESSTISPKVHSKLPVNQKYYQVSVSKFKTNPYVQDPSF
jgi:hypothetical protein